MPLTRLAFPAIMIAGLGFTLWALKK